MKLNADHRRALGELLALTEEDELDCDRFNELLPEIVEAAIDDADLLARIEHHKRICPPCGEALDLIRKCLED